MILITGTSGFLGSKLMNAVLDDIGYDKVLALTSKPMAKGRFLIHNNYDFEDNYFERSGYSDIHTIIHVGAATPKNQSEANDWALANSNILSTDKLLKASMHGLKKFIYISTIDVYGDDEIISESTVLKPFSLYGTSKLYCEKMLEQWSITNKINFQILRVGHVYGPGEEKYEKLIPNTIKKLIKGEPIEIWGEGVEKRSFIYIDDVIKAIRNSIRIPESSEPINIVGSLNINVNNLINKIILISGLKPEVKNIQNKIRYRDIVFDNSRMNKILGTETITLDAGLRAEWEYMKGLYL